MEPDFRKKIFLARNGEIGVKNMHIRAFLGNQSLDFLIFGMRLALYITSNMA